MPDFLTLRPSQKTPRSTSKTLAKTHLILAHGAGAPMTSSFMTQICERLANLGVATTRFEFAYMAARRENGTRRPPPKAEKLIPEYLEVIARVRDTHDEHAQIVIGGKSMGGRVASMIADDQFANGAIAGLVCLGYPFHPPKKPTNLRTAHLLEFRCPTLIIQGERDALGNKSEVSKMSLSTTIAIHWAKDGDHDLAPRVRSGHTHEGNIDDAAGAISGFLAQRRPPIPH